MKSVSKQLQRSALTLVAVTLTLSVSGASVRYVNANNPNPAPPYTNWATAARTIQEAVDVATAGEQILVTNGLYSTGGRAVDGLMTNRVAVCTALTVSSVNGPANTFISGYQIPGTLTGNGAIRCVYLTNGAVLSGFTLTNGATRATGDPICEQSGGGVWCAASAVVTNCTLTGNWARNYGGGAEGGRLNNCVLTGNKAGLGGGADWGTLNNCTLTGNWATNSGGGACYGTLNNCVLTGNEAAIGGGAYYSTLNNCIIYSNSAPYDANYTSGSLRYCCTTPLPTGGTGNFTNAPLFVDYAGGNLRLQATSPCVDSGSSAYVATSVDLDGNPRVVGRSVDVGAYECQNPAPGLQMPVRAVDGLVLSWSAIAGRTYQVEYKTNLAQPNWSPLLALIPTNFVGTVSTTNGFDPQRFYRIVLLP